MPIKIPNQLPATSVLTSENIFVMTETRAITQDIRPLQILLLNLMPTKIETETQLARVLGNTHPDRAGVDRPQRPRVQEHLPGPHAGLLQIL